jgi:hypothetical protein
LDSDSLSIEEIKDVNHNCVRSIFIATCFVFSGKPSSSGDVKNTQRNIFEITKIQTLHNSTSTLCISRKLTEIQNLRKHTSYKPKIDKKSRIYVKYLVYKYNIKKIVQYFGREIIEEIKNVNHNCVQCTFIATCFVFSGKTSSDNVKHV